MKIKIFILALLAFSGQNLLSMTHNQKRAIRKELYGLYDSKSTIGLAQLREPDITIEEVIDRDLEILMEHKVKMQGKIDGQKSFFNRSFGPGVNKIVTVTSGLISSATGLFAVGGYEWVRGVWKGDSFVKFGDWAVDKGFKLGILTQKDVFNYTMEKVRYLDQANPEFIKTTVLVECAAAVSVVTGLLCVGGIYTWCTYKGKIAAYVTKVKQRLERDQTLISQLKELKYSTI